MNLEHESLAQLLIAARVADAEQRRRVNRLVRARRLSRRAAQASVRAQRLSREAALAQARVAGARVASIS